MQPPAVARMLEVVQERTKGTLDQDPAREGDANRRHQAVVKW